MEIIQSLHLIEKQIKAKPEDKRKLFKIIFGCGKITTKTLRILMYHIYIKGGR